MTDAILNITDGTTTISLINESSGFHLVNWVPAITDYKGGGVFQDPPLADWRQLRVAKWTTAVENFGLTINGQNPDNAAYNLQELRRLLEKANAYWTTNWQNTPVYIEARAKCETNTRYCLVVKGRLANDQNYYRQPFTGNRTTMRDLPLIIERRAWLDNTPGTGTAIPLSAVETYNGVDYGNVDSSEVREPTTADAVYIANKGNVANITNIYNFDSSLASFGSNLLGAALPITLFPNPAGANDIVYFGISTAVSDSGPFTSLVFDIATAAAAGTSFTLTWEYWGGSWLALSVQDNTNSFQNTGVNSVNWDQPDGWTTTSINSVTAYWVRVRLSALTGAFTNPTQQNRNIYSVVWPYVEIQASALGGDITALARIIVRQQADKDGPGGSAPTLYSGRTLVGLRSYDRGPAFTAYINCADEQNPSGITASVGTNSSFTNSEFGRSPSGRAVLYNPGGAEAMATRVTITIDDTIISDFFGTFHVFVRTTLDGSSQDFSIRMKFTNTGGGEAVTESVQVVEDSPILDLGVVTIPGFIVAPGDIPDQSTIEIQASAVTGSSNLYFHDIILIPVDEWAADIIDDANTNESTLEQGRYLDIDSVTAPKGRRSLIRIDSNDQVAANWGMRTNGPPITQANSRQRLWFLNMLHPSTASDTTFESPIGMGFSIQLQVNQRYLSLRGER